MADSYVSPGSIIQTFAGWMSASDYANFFGVALVNGQVPVPGTTNVQMPDGIGIMDAASINHFQQNPPPAGGGGTPPTPAGDAQTLAQAQQAIANQQQQANQAASRQSAVESAKANFPWAYSIGLGSLIEDAARRGLGADGIVAEIRQSQPYKIRFPGIIDDDGTMLMDEGSYLQRERDYKTVLHDAGKLTGNEQPADFLAFFKGKIDPNELKTRLDTYTNIEHSSDDIKSAFYVYAGMKLSTDDLYQAVVKPGAQEALLEQYNQRVAAQPIDYETWITRATEAGLSRTAATLTRLQQQGLVGAQAVAQLQQIDPTMARDIMAQLHAGTPGDPGGTQTLNLDELQHAFQYALLGSAAQANGLALPSAERLEALRQAGVTRAAALKGYGDIGTKQNLWQGEIGRAGLGPMDQADFEKALLLNNGPQTEELKQAQGFEDSLAQRTGFAALRQGKDGQLEQAGLNPVNV